MQLLAASTICRYPDDLRHQAPQGDSYNATGVSMQTFQFPPSRRPAGSVGLQTIPINDFRAV